MPLLVLIHEDVIDFLLDEDPTPPEYTSNDSAPFFESCVNSRIESAAKVSALPGTVVLHTVVTGDGPGVMNFASKFHFLCQLFIF